MDGGEETIEEAEALAQVRRQARRVQLQASVAAVILTILGLAIPG